ncbi:MAG: transglutaminase family protein [Chloroflexi bacterium]|nr:transglutaminase family protein [Chloroflexota bacterium]
MEGSIRDDFASAIEGPSEAVDLFGAAMTIARIGRDSIDVHDYARRLDLVAEQALDYAGGATDPHRLASAIDYQLFSILGFHGNVSAYDEPENSYLDQVIDRRTGIPITLSLVYMEIAQRIGLRCDGIGYPGHFIVRVGEPEEPIFVDPFHQGARLDPAELRAGLRAHDLGAANPDSVLAAVTRRQILQRMLNNLHAVFRARRDVERWRTVVDLQLRLEPWNAALVGERGMLHYRMGDHLLALEDLSRYVDAGARETVPGAAVRLLDELRLRYPEREGER